MKNSFKIIKKTEIEVKSKNTEFALLLSALSKLKQDECVLVDLKQFKITEGTLRARLFRTKLGKFWLKGKVNQKGVRELYITKATR